VDNLGDDLIIRLDDNKINIKSDKSKTKETIEIKNHPLINKLKERINKNNNESNIINNNDMIDETSNNNMIDETSNNNNNQKIDTT